MNSKQNREGLPDALLDERRFFELYGESKTATPAGWNNPENWKDLDDIPENSFFGFAIGNGTDYLFIDGDHVTDPDTGKLLPWVEDVYHRITATAPTYFERSQSGTGFHMIADLGDFADNFAKASNEYNEIIVQMDPGEYNALPREEKEKVPKIEFWYHTDGRYAYLTGKHKKLYQVAKDEDAAAIFSELLEVRKEYHAKYGKKAEYREDRTRIETDAATKKRVLEALPYISANSREIWVRVGLALSNCGFPFEVWDEWSKYTDQLAGVLCDKYKPEETPKIWKSFRNTKSNWNAGTIIKLAKDRGYQTRKDQESSTERKKRPHIQVLEDIEEKSAEWLVPKYIPKGNITLLASDGGSGKTFIWCNIMAAVTTGTKCILEQDIPFEVKQAPQNVMYFSSEDSSSVVLKRRLRLAGADMKRVLFVDMSDEEFDSIKFNSEELAEIIAEYRPGLCVFDPIQSFIPTSVNMSSRNAMRQCLSPVSALGEKYGTTFLIVLHTNKKQNVFGRSRIADSADIWDASRSVLMSGATGEKGIFYLSHEKSNYSALQETVLYAIEDEKATYRGRSDKRDADYMREASAAQHPAPARNEAKDMIAAFLKDHEWHKVDELDSTLLGGGVSFRTLKRAKADMKDSGRIAYKCEGFSPKVFYVRLVSGVES